MNGDYQYFSPKNDFDNFNLFLKFLRTSKKMGKNNFSWAQSLDVKFRAIQILYNEVIAQIPKWQGEMEKVRIEGIASGIEGEMLTIRYEMFMNSIYGFCENLSYIVYQFYPQANLSRGFNDQKKQFLLSDTRKSKRIIDPDYSKILERTSWYNEIHDIRTESTHYLTGVIYSSGKGEPGYFNLPINGKTSISQESKISKESIRKHIHDIYQELSVFLDEFSKHFLQMCEGDQAVPKLCIRLSDGRTGWRTITLNDYLNGNPRKCAAMQFDCPYESCCNALDKPSSKS